MKSYSDQERRGSNKEWETLKHILDQNMTKIY